MVCHHGEREHEPNGGAALPGQEPGGEDPASRKETRVHRLLRKGEHRKAVDLAKLLHKKERSAASETLLQEAYLARVGGLFEKGLRPEAEALAGLLREQFPGAARGLQELLLEDTLRTGSVDDLARLLADPDLPDERRMRLEEAIRARLADPEDLARTKALPDGHPLREAAAAISKAFRAVTSGVVEDSELSLPQVSRRGPLAPWKHLIRALACFHRYEDPACERHLGAIHPESRPARLAPVLRSLMEGRRLKDAAPAVKQLAEKTGSIPASVEEALEALDKSLVRRRSKKPIYVAIRNAMRACEQACPELVVRLRQRISIRCCLLDLPVDDVQRAQGGPSLKDTHFWQLYARLMETQGDWPRACSVWEEFRRHAVQEGRFPETGPETAVLYCHMADLLSYYSKKSLQEIQRVFEMTFGGYHQLYKEQPAAVRAAEPPPGPPDLYFLDPDRLYRRAVAADPRPETFRRWLDWTRCVVQRVRDADRVALAWHEAHPDDTTPLLHLLESAERRSAFKKALEYLERAEQVDRLDPRVRGARLRIELAALRRHLVQGKLHLAEKRFPRLEQLPQAGEADRPAVLAALRWVFEELRERREEGKAFQDRVLECLGSREAATLILRGVARLCDLPKPDWPAIPEDSSSTPRRELAAAMGRASLLARDLEIPLEIPRTWEGPLIHEVSGPSCCLDSCQLRSLAETAFAQSSKRLIYAVAGAGLRRGGPGAPRFLLFRARSLPDWAGARRMDCLRAVIALARRQGDLDLLEEANRERLADESARGFFPGLVPAEAEAPDPKIADGVLARERDETKYPKRRRKAGTAADDDLDDEPSFLDVFLDDDPDELLPLADDDGDVEELEELEHLIAALPPELRMMLDSMVRELQGESPGPESVVEFLREKLGVDLPFRPERKPRKRRRRRRRR